MNSSACSQYRFGGFALDLDRELLLHGDAEIRLRPKCFEVLRVLVEHHGRLVTKDDLHEKVWAPAAVSDDSLSHCLNEIRRALGDANRDMISTVPRRGYVFEPDVEFVGRGPADGRPRRIRLARVMVAGALLTMGIAALLWFQFGSAGRIATAALDAEPAVPLESRSLPRAGDMIAEVDPDAYEHYRQGRFFYDRRAPGDVDRAEEAYRRAVEFDPSLTAAWTGLAAVYNIRFFDGDLPEEEAIALLGEAAHRALALEPDNGEALARMAAYFQRIGQSGLAQLHFERALESEPNNPLLLSILAGRFFHAARFDEAVAVQRRAAELAPLSAVYRCNLVAYLLHGGHTTAALEELETVEALKPSDAAHHARMRTDLLILEGRYDEALVPAQTLEDDDIRNSRLAIIHAALGSSTKAQAALESLAAGDSATTPYRFAEVYSWRGDADAAFHWLYRAGDPVQLRSLAARERQHANRHLMSPLLAPLRQDPRWHELVAGAQPDIELRPEWLASAY